MRVLIDAFWWFDGPPSNRMVIRELVRAWADTYPDDELFVAVPRGRVEEARTETPSSVVVVPVRGGQHALATMFGLPMLARSLAVDVMFCQAFTPVRGFATTFVHDVLFQSNPEWFTRAERLYLASVPRTARRANVVFTSSQNEARRIQKWNRRLDSVEPVGLAVSTALLGSAPTPPPGADQLEGFLLSVGRLNVRKNLMFALEAALQSGRLSSTRPLLVVGAPDGQQDDLPPPVARAIDDGLIRYLGHVSDAELAWLYGNSDLFIYLSLDEGFGLPPLEALSFGCPVLVSDVPIFREVVGDAGRFVSPWDLPAASAAIAESPQGLSKQEAAVALPQWSDTIVRIRSRIAAELSRAGRVRVN